MERLRLWGKRLTLALSLLLFTAVVSMIVVVIPFVRDDLVLDQIVVAVVLDWRDFGLEAANERLQFEMDNRGIGMQVGDEHCVLEEPTAGGYRVRCDWSVDIALPGVRRRVPLKFSSKAGIYEDGELR
jgi:hypothetical protein